MDPDLTGTPEAPLPTHCENRGGAADSCSICLRAVLDASPLDRGALRAALRVAFSKPQLV